MLSETLHTTSYTELSRLHFSNFSASNHSEKWNIIWWLMKQVGNKITILYCQLKLSVLFWDILLIHRIRNISCIFLPLRDFNLWSSYFIVAYMFLALINREDYTQTKPGWPEVWMEYLQTSLESSYDIMTLYDIVTYGITYDLLAGLYRPYHWCGFHWTIFSRSRCCNLNSALLWLRVCWETEKYPDFYFL